MDKINSFVDLPISHVDSSSRAPGQELPPRATWSPDALDNWIAHARRSSWLVVLAALALFILGDSPLPNKTDRAIRTLCTLEKQLAQSQEYDLLFLLRLSLRKHTRENHPYFHNLLKDSPWYLSTRAVSGGTLDLDIVVPSCLLVLGDSTSKADGKLIPVGSLHPYTTQIGSALYGSSRDLDDSPVPCLHNFREAWDALESIESVLYVEDLPGAREVDLEGLGTNGELVASALELALMECGGSLESPALLELGLLKIGEDLWAATDSLSMIRTSCDGSQQNQILQFPFDQERVVTSKSQIVETSIVLDRPEEPAQSRGGQILFAVKSQIGRLNLKHTLCDILGIPKTDDTFGLAFPEFADLEPGDFRETFGSLHTTLRQRALEDDERGISIVGIRLTIAQASKYGVWIMIACQLYLALILRMARDLALAPGTELKEPWLGTDGSPDTRLVVGLAIAGMPILACLTTADQSASWTSLQPALFISPFVGFITLVYHWRLLGLVPDRN